MGLEESTGMANEALHRKAGRQRGPAKCRVRRTPRKIDSASRAMIPLRAAPVRMLNSVSISRMPGRTFSSGSPPPIAPRRISRPRRPVLADAALAGGDDLVHDARCRNAIRVQRATGEPERRTGTTVPTARVGFPLDCGALEFARPRAWTSRFLRVSRLPGKGSKSPHF